MAEHTEAKCLAFSEIHLDGMKWCITLREGVSAKEVKGLLVAIKFTKEHAVKEGFRVPGVKAEAKAEPAKPAEPKQETPRLAQGQNANDNPLQVGRFKVSGTTDKPVVELYSVNKRLKYPVIRPAFSVLHAVIAQKYPDLDIAALSECGKEGSITWLVGWRPSEKNPKWRDLVFVTIPKLEPRE